MSSANFLIKQIMKKTKNILLFSFASNFPEIHQKLSSYLSIYEQFSKIPINDNNYTTTLYRGLIIYFLYRENELGNKITTKQIAEIFGFKNHSTVVYSNKRTKFYTEHPNAINSKDKIQFLYFFYRFNQIFSKRFE